MTQRAEFMQSSPAYGVLRASSRRLLRFIEYEIARNGGRPVMLYNDQFAVVGSVRVIPPGLSELHALGLIEVTRYPKRHMCALSERWRDIASKQDAIIISARARTLRMPPQTPQPATASSHAQA